MNKIKDRYTIRPKKSVMEIINPELEKMHLTFQEFCNGLLIQYVIALKERESKGGNIDQIRKTIHRANG